MAGASSLRSPNSASAGDSAPGGSASTTRAVIVLPAQLGRLARWLLSKSFAPIPTACSRRDKRPGLLQRPVMSIL